MTKMGRVEEKEGRMEGSEAGFTGFIGFAGLGSLNCDLGISRIERGRESEFPPTKICTHF